MQAFFTHLALYNMNQYPICENELAHISDLPIGKMPLVHNFLLVCDAVSKNAKTPVPRQIRRFLNAKKPT